MGGRHLGCTNGVPVVIFWQSLEYRNFLQTSHYPGFLYFIVVYLWLFLELADYCCDCAMDGYTFAIIYSRDQHVLAKVFLQLFFHVYNTVGVSQFPQILLHIPNEIRFCKLFLTLDLAVSVRRPFARFESVSLPCFL